MIDTKSLEQKFYEATKDTFSDEVSVKPLARQIANEILMIGMWVGAHFPTTTDEEIGIHRDKYLSLISQSIQNAMDSAFSEGFEKGSVYNR